MKRGGEEICALPSFRAAKIFAKNAQERLLRRLITTGQRDKTCQFGLYHVVVPASFRLSNHPCFIVMFLFLADQIFDRSQYTCSIFVCGLLVSLFLVFLLRIIGK